jgi:hypothetical protein
VAPFGWMLVLSIVLGIFLPTIGPFSAGAALLSILLIGLPIIGFVFGLWVAVVVVLNILGLLAGALAGALVFG